MRSNLTFRTFPTATSCSCEHISLNHADYAAFFVKKVGTKKAFRGITPRSLPPCTVKNLPSSHSLLLCHHLKWGAVAKEMLVHRSQLRDRPCGLYPTFKLHAVACGVSLFARYPRTRTKRSPRIRVISVLLAQRNTHTRGDILYITITLFEY